MVGIAETSGHFFDLHKFDKLTECVMLCYSADSLGAKHAEVARNRDRLTTEKVGTATIST